VKAESKASAIIQNAGKANKQNNLDSNKNNHIGPLAKTKTENALKLCGKSSTFYGV